jgi:predicted small lipoprotein YifL
MKKFLFLIFIFALTGCGRKGPLVRPEALIPGPVSDLRTAQKGERFQVSWSPPSREEGGRGLKDLAGFRLFKREVLPPGEDCEACPDAYRLLKEIDLEYLQDVRSFSGRLFLSDDAVLAGTTYQYKIVSFRKDGTSSRDSARARRKKVVPPAAPRLQGVFSATGVLLHWPEVVSPGNSKVIGYNVYRRRADALPALVPLNSAPVPGPDFEDLRLDRSVTYGYAVSTVAEIEGETVESAPSNEVLGTPAEPG